MMEEIVTPEATIETPATPPATPAVYFNSDGTFNEGWQSTLPDGYNEDPSLKTVKDGKLLAKMFVDTKRMVGKGKMAIPNEHSPKDEWDEYYRIGGRPDTVDDYKLAPPQEFPPELAEKVFPKDRLAKWQQRFYDGGVSKKAADQFIAEFANDMLEDSRNQQIVAEQQLAELTGGLSRDWGSAYSQKIHLGNIAIEEGTAGNQEFKDRVVAKVQNDPDLTRLLANLGGKFSEGKSPEFTNIPTPADINDQINELMANPILTDPKSLPNQRKPIMDKIMALRAKLAPETANT